MAILQWSTTIWQLKWMNGLTYKSQKEKKSYQVKKNKCRIKSIRYNLSLKTKLCNIMFINTHISITFGDVGKQRRLEEK